MLSARFRTTARTSMNAEAVRRSHQTNRNAKRAVDGTRYHFACSARERRKSIVDVVRARNRVMPSGSRDLNNAAAPARSGRAESLGAAKKTHTAVTTTSGRFTHMID